MMREDLLVHHTGGSSGEFVAPMPEAVGESRKRFVQQAIRGILSPGSLVMMELDR